jgi:hypothetical protein
MAGFEKTPAAIADLIDRFLSDQLTSRGEWYDFVDRSQRNPKLDVFRKQCAFFSDQLATDKKSLDLSRNDRWKDAKQELKAIADHLRAMEKTPINPR